MKELNDPLENYRINNHNHVDYIWKYLKSVSFYQLQKKYVVGQRS